jgi:DNA-binding CsgD family transcriptional regulator
LFVKNWDNTKQNEEFRLIPGTNRQVWYLGIHDGVLLCGHNSGTFVIDGETAHQISSVPGAWKFHSLKRFPGYLIGGTYSGLILLKKQGNNWTYVDKIQGFNESFRIFEEDENGDLWMSHGFKGIYKISIGNRPDSISSVRFFTQNDGLPSNYNLNIFKIKGRILVASKSGIYELNTSKNRFESSDYFNQLLNPLKEISYLNEDKEGNIWYVAREKGKNEAGELHLRGNGSYEHISAPFDFLTGKLNGGFESVYCYSNDHIFFGTEEGFAHYSPFTGYKNTPKFEAYINRAAALHLDSTFFDGKLCNENADKHYRNIDFKFPYKNNKFRFSYTSPVYENQENVQYSFMLEGYDDNWSDWRNIPTNEYTKLPPGKYTFKVKARTQMGNESTTDILNFSIMPPWHRTIFAYLIYSLLAILLILSLVWYLLKRIEISKRKEKLKNLRSYRKKEQEYRREALIAEKEIINLKNEKLKAEMIHRDKELANQTMDLIRKNKFLLKIQDDLEKLKQFTSDKTLKDKIALLVTRINKDLDHKKQWEVFETAFDEVHEDFLSRLKEQYPNLTPKELKLCAYLRMNISTKEIAPMMNISVRGVEICRYRVRKKLNIDRDQNLTSLIIDL